MITKVVIAISLVILVAIIFVAITLGVGKRETGNTLTTGYDGIEKIHSYIRINFDDNRGKEVKTLWI